MSLSSLSRGCARIISPESGGLYSGRLDVCFTPRVHDYFIWKSHDSLLRLSKSGHLIGEDETAIPKTYSSRKGPLLLYAQDLATVESLHESAEVPDEKLDHLQTINHLPAAILTYNNEQMDILPPLLSSLHLQRTLHLQRLGASVPRNRGKEPLLHPDLPVQVNASVHSCRPEHFHKEHDVKTDPMFPRLTQNSSGGSKHHVNCVRSEAQQLPPMKARKPACLQSHVPKHSSRLCLPLLGSLEKDNDHLTDDVGRHRSLAFVQKVQDFSKSHGGAVRGLLPLELRDLQSSRAVGCFVLGPDGEVIRLSLYEDQDEESVGSSYQVLSEEAKAFPLMVVLQSEESFSEIKATFSTSEALMDTPEEQKLNFQMPPLWEVVESRAADVHEEEVKQEPKNKHHEQDPASGLQHTSCPQSPEETSVTENMEEPRMSESLEGAVERRKKETAETEDGWKSRSRDKEPRKLVDTEKDTRKEVDQWSRKSIGEMRPQIEGEPQPLRNQKPNRRPEKETRVLPAPTEKTTSEEDETPADRSLESGPEKEKPEERRTETKMREEIQGKTRLEDKRAKQKKPLKLSSTQRQVHDSNTSGKTDSSPGTELVQSEGPVESVAKVSTSSLHKALDKASTPIGCMEPTLSRGRLSSSCSTVAMREEQLMLNPSSRSRKSLHRELEETEAASGTRETVRAKQEEDKRKEQEEEEQKKQREERMRKMLEEERRKRLEEKRLKKQAEEEKARNLEEAAQEQTRRKRAEREREKRQREEKKQQMEKILRVREEQRRRAELELLEEERQEEEERIEATDESKRKKSPQKRREDEEDLWSAEETRKQAELLTREVALLQHQLRFKRGLLLEAEGLDRSQEISRPWIYSYFNIPQMPGQGPDHDP